MNNRFVIFLVALFVVASCVVVVSAEHKNEMVPYTYSQEGFILERSNEAVRSIVAGRYILTKTKSNITGRNAIYGFDAQVHILDYASAGAQEDINALNPSIMVGKLVAMESKTQDYVSLEERIVGLQYNNPVAIVAAPKIRYSVIYMEERSAYNYWSIGLRFHERMQKRKQGGSIIKPLKFS